MCMCNYVLHEIQNGKTSTLCNYNMLLGFRYHKAGYISPYMYMYMYILFIFILYTCIYMYILTSILFQNVVDILVGWHIDTQQDESLITFIGGMWVTIATKKKLCSYNSDNTCL